MTKYLDPTNDLAFKKVFGDKARMIKLLNALMRLPEELMIEDLEEVSTEQIPDLGQLKRSIIDIKCKDRQGNTYIVEMQNGYAESFLKRTQFYASKALTNQVQRGMTYASIAPVILIAIVHDFKPLKDENLDVITFHRTVEVTTNKSYLKDLSYVFVELDRFNKTEVELQTFEDHWLFFLSKWYSLNHPPKNLKDEDVLSAYEVIDQFNWTPGELEAYEKIKLATDTDMLNLKSKFQEGLDKGREEGIEIGEARGEARGIEKTAINMIKQNLDFKLISQVTGFSEQEIQKLKDRFN